MNLTKHALPDRQEMLQATMKRDASYDGLFYTCVKTTMIFCRPSCPARKPRPENIEFCATAREAVFSGFRPCRRCQPLQLSAGTGKKHPGWVAGLIAAVDADPGRRIRDADLRARDLDPAAVRRYFLKTFDMTFHAFSRARRLGAAFSAIQRGARIDDAVFEYGWESHSGFREAFSRMVDAPPGAARRRECIHLTWIETPLGPMVAGATQSAVCFLEFTERRMLEAQLETLKRRFQLPALPGESPLFEPLQAELEEYFAGRRRSFSLPLAYPGTDFQCRVWEALMRIPYGETRCYSAVAVELNSPGAARAVGQANGLNRIAILIPCHRIINADGSAGGYGGGLWRKLRLLELEGSLPRSGENEPPEDRER